MIDESLLNVVSSRDIRTVAKRLLFTVSLALTSPLILLAWIEKGISASELVFVGLGQLLALVPGIAGSYLRSAYYFGTLDGCSWEIHIGFGSFFSHRGASVGSRASVGAYCVIGTASIGEGVMIASRVSITSGKRQHFDDEGRLSSDPTFEKVSIGRGSWIGEGAIILADVGDSCVVSAGTIVTKGAPGGYLIAGNPGKPIRELKAQKADAAES